MKKYILLLVFLTQANADDGEFCQQRTACQPGFRCPVIYVPCNDGDLETPAFRSTGYHCRREIDPSNEKQMDDLKLTALENADLKAHASCGDGLAIRVSEPSFSFYPCTRAAGSLAAHATADYQCQ